MARSVLDMAQALIKRRRFAKAITILEARAKYYKDNFEYYLSLGIACLYLGDIGNSYHYFTKAREIKLTSSRLLLGQAAIFLRRGNTDRALQYYLEVLESDPGNVTAKEAMEFIRVHGDYDTICRWVDSGKIEQFYPPLGMNPDIIRNGVLVGLAVGLVVSGFLFFRSKQQYNLVGPRANLSGLELSSDERRHAETRTGQSLSAYYMLDTSAITKSYSDSLQYFQEHRDNAARVEINRLLNSNASDSIKQKASLLAGYLSDPTFDTLTDSFSYGVVASDPVLYRDCFVVWAGRISNARLYENGSWACDMLVGYEDMKHVDGIVPLHFEQEPVPPIDVERAVRVLAKVSISDGRVSLEGRAVYQPLAGKTLP